MRPILNKPAILPFVCGALLLLVGCKPVTAPPANSPPAPQAVALAPAATQPGAEAPNPPPAVEYNLGDATLVQERFPEDSRFRNMPINGSVTLTLPLR